MSKRAFKSQASSSRAASAQSTLARSFGASGSTFGSASSPISYLAELPDLSNISDAYATVSFKALSKKDGVTKAKALEELEGYLEALKERSEEVEQAFLEAWIKVYPRLSIDISRRVRQMSHTLHGKVAQSCGKRVARFMPQAVGPWMTGVHDGDKSVMRSATDSLNTIFSAPEKIQGLKKAYQLPLLQYCSDVLLRETSKTLSDERTTTHEEADAKYFRVVASSLLIIVDLLEALPQAEIMKQNAMYADVLGSVVVWDHVRSEDSTVRRSILKLIKICATRKEDLVSENLFIMTSALLSKSTASRQNGSALSFSEALLALCSIFPHIWSLKLTGKAPMIARLQAVFQYGSQGTSATFWSNMAKVFATVPTDLLPTTKDDASTMLDSIHAGILRKDEPRANLEAAWNSYFSISEIIYARLKPSDQEILFYEAEFPLVLQYLAPRPENSHWTVNGPRPVAVAANVLRHASTTTRSLEAELEKVANALLDSIRLSLPEQSEDFELSQKSVILYGERWYTLQSEALKEPISDSLVRAFRNSTFCITNGALDVLKSRHGKPFGAAGVVEASMRIAAPLISEDRRTSTILSNFILNDLPELLFSPSSSYLTPILYRMWRDSNFDMAWEKSLDHILCNSDPLWARNTLQAFLSSPQMPSQFMLAVQNDSLQGVISAHVEDAINGKEDWKFISQLLGAPSQILRQQTVDHMLAEMTECLAIEDRAPSTLKGLNAISTSDESLLHSFLSSSHGSQLLQRVLLLTESRYDDISQQASDLYKKIASTGTHAGREILSSQSLINVIRNGLVNATIDSLSVETLVDLTKRVTENCSSEERISIMKRTLPDSRLAMETIALFLREVPSLELSIISDLGGTIFLVEKQDTLSTGMPIPRDQDGKSPALRLAQYVVKAIKACIEFEMIDSETFTCVYCHLVLTSQLSNDNLSVARTNDLWSIYSSEMEEEMIEFISETQDLLAEWHKFVLGDSSFAKDVESYMTAAHRILWSNSLGLSPSAFQNARAISGVISRDIDVNGWHPPLDLILENSLQEYRKSLDTLSYTAFLGAYKVPLLNVQSVARTCNELIADLTGLNVDAKPKTCLTQLVILNLVTVTQEQTVETVAKQRLVFFVKHTVPWLNVESVEPTIKAEVCKALTTLLPSIIDVYGGHWLEIFDYLAALWIKPILPLFDRSSANLSLVHASLRLLSCLKKYIKDEDANEDLREAWDDSKKALGNGLLKLLTQLYQKPDLSNQALRITNELLARQLSAIQSDLQINIAELFPLMLAESEAIQRCAFGILHLRIPKGQQEISVNAALDKIEARLPEELLSLVLQAPNPTTSNDRFNRVVPLSIRGYLNSWILIFDHFKFSSDKVKADYANQIKNGDYIDPLLNFIATFLKLTDSKPIDISKFEITSYDFDVDDSPIKDTQWMVAHIYYLCLAYVSSLTKIWLINAKSRQLTSKIQNWTEKYFSPCLISVALESVTNWAATQDSLSDEALVIKTNLRTKSITASREIDDQMLSISISLPSDFPFGQVKVEGISRVAVDEKKWNQWLLITQGIIKFSDNNVVDGLIAFRRNVNGALKGQSECAICYSIVGADKQLPTKRCGTCKNLFHGSCLYRWFKTSNSSSCPLCRNAFNYS